MEKKHLFASEVSKKSLYPPRTFSAARSSFNVEVIPSDMTQAECR